MCNSSGAYRVLSDRRILYQDRNQWTAGLVGGHFEVVRGSVLVVVLYMRGGGNQDVDSKMVVIGASSFWLMCFCFFHVLFFFLLLFMANRIE